MKINLSNIIFVAYYYFITKNKLTIKIKDTFLSSLIYTFIHLYIIHTNLQCICNSRSPIKIYIRIKKYRQNVPQFSNSLIAHDRDYEKQDFSIWKGRKKISIGPWTRIRGRLHAAVIKFALFFCIAELNGIVRTNPYYYHGLEYLYTRFYRNRNF